MESGIILIVDDSENMLASLELLLENEFGTVRIAANPSQIATLLTATSINIIIPDMDFSADINNGNEGLCWLKQAHEIHPSLPVVALTAYGDVELAAKALKDGATDFLLKPWDNQILIRRIKEAYKSNDSKARSASETTGKQGDTEGPNKPEILVGHSPAVLQLIKVVTKATKTGTNILITEEDRTGKEILAREIHRLSPRNSHQMLDIGMGAISESLFGSELFGHERGASTDTYESRPRKFEAANGSSLFMDEIGDPSIALQAKLLTILQNQSVTRIGSNKAIPADIRLISATNKDIPETVKQGLFREDLFYCISTIRLEIPPLRERGDDILLFIDTFLRRFAFKYQRPDIRIHGQTIKKLCPYHWPGDIRELQHAIGKAVILCEGNVIRPKGVLIKQSWRPQTASITPNLEEAERQTIETTILRNSRNLTAAAGQLGISRQTLYNRLRRFEP